MYSNIHRILNFRIRKLTDYLVKPSLQYRKFFYILGSLIDGHLASNTRKITTSWNKLFHYHTGLYVCVKVTQSCLTLCNSMDYTVHEILQAGILEWVFPFSRGSSQPGDGTQVSHIAGRHVCIHILILLVSQGQNITEFHQLKTLFTLKKVSHFLF